MGKDEVKKNPRIRNYEVWSRYLCDIYKKPAEEKDENDKKKFLAYYKFSFPYRREYITSDKEPTVTDIKKMYPYLFHKDQVFLEFELIAEKSNMFDMFMKNVEIYAPEIMKCTPSSSFKEKIESQIKKADEGTKNWIEKAGSLLLLSKYLNEERKGIITFNKETVPSDQEGRPYIACTEEIENSLGKEVTVRVIIEEIELCTVNNLIEAYFALMSAYYIFNAMYPSCCKNTFYCLEKLYVEYSEDAEEMEDKVEELISALEKYGSQKKKHTNNNGTE